MEYFIGNISFSKKGLLRISFSTISVINLESTVLLYSSIRVLRCLKMMSWISVIDK